MRSMLHGSNARKAQLQRTPDKIVSIYPGHEDINSVAANVNTRAAADRLIMLFTPISGRNNHRPRIPVPQSLQPIDKI